MKGNGILGEKKGILKGISILVNCVFTSISNTNA